MKTSTNLVILWTVMVIVMAAFGVQEAPCQQQPPPPVSAPMVREGDFAMTLAVALDIGSPTNEIEAESMLGKAGIAPRNGWIADYPVTPDIIGELRDSVGYAAQAKTIQMDKGKALKVLESVQANAAITMTPAPAGQPSDYSTAGSPAAAEQGAPVYPDQVAIGDYYQQQGPPIMTYYAPPPDYYYLYSWVPYPFWWSEFWFGGYFILHDFHRFHHHGHFISNHFNDFNAHRVFRVDPVARLNGRTFSGIGAPRGIRSISPGVRGASQRIFNRDRSLSPRAGIGASRTTAGAVRPATRGAINNSHSANPFQERHVYSRPAGAGRAFQPQSMTRGSGPHGTANRAAGRGAGRGAKR